MRVHMHIPQKLVWHIHGIDHWDRLPSMTAPSSLVLLQCVVVCSVLWWVTVVCTLMQCVLLQFYWNWNRLPSMIITLTVVLRMCVCVCMCACVWQICVVVSCSELQRVAVSCSVSLCVAACSELQWVAVCGSVQQCVATRTGPADACCDVAAWCSTLQGVDNV